MNRKDLKSIIQEAYEEVLLEADQKMSPDNIAKPRELPASFLKGVEQRYGKVSKDDFFSKDLSTYYKMDGRNDTTKSVSHKVIRLPSFSELYNDFSDIILDIKKMMNNKDVRNDRAARDLFELIKTNFRKLQTYLRTERPDQYAMLKMRRNMEEAIAGIKKKYPTPDMVSEDIDKEPKPEEPGDPKAPKETVLEDATDTILSKFPTLKAAIVKLQTEDFKDFVESIDWVSPRPSSFRVNLKNGQDYTLKWMGESFQATILGKRYYLNNISEYQQALDKLEVLYREAPMSGAGEGGEVDTDTGGGGGGGGEFPGGDGGGAEGGDDLGGDDIAADDGGGADLSDEPIDFEAGEEPDA